ncbi:MAG: histidine kinase, partial [Bacteroidetes bacterium]
MSAWIILLVGAAYLALLFGVAWMAERMSHSGRSLVRNPYVYALSLAVYCTAWTFYGSVGKASADGLNFLAIYLGPSLAAPLWFVVLRKLILICRHQRISSIADFISARYGKSAFLGGLVTSMAVVGIIPYISLQLKAISFSYDILSQGNSISGQVQGSYFYQDTAFYVAVVLAVFTIFFGTRHLDANDRHEGLVAAVAFESLVKLLAFVAVGLFVTYEVYHGVGDLFANARANEHLARLMDWKQSVNPWDWCWLMVISMFAVLFLPRQFHMAVVENTDPGHVDKATWLFPLYLLIINLFVLPVAFAGHLHFHASGVDADTYVLGLPLLYGKQALALLVFIGGLSA